MRFAAATMEFSSVTSNWIARAPNLLGRSLAALEIARPDQHSEAVCYEILCDLKTDSLISPGDEGDGFVMHR
jgi:hypothetical protein